MHDESSPYKNNLTAGIIRTAAYKTYIARAWPPARACDRDQATVRCWLRQLVPCMARQNTGLVRRGPVSLSLNPVAAGRERSWDFGCLCDRVGRQGEKGLWCEALLLSG